MAGYTREQHAAIAAYKDAHPEKEWKELTKEEKDAWLLTPRADQEPYRDSQVDPDDLRKLPTGQVVDRAAMEAYQASGGAVPWDELSAEERGIWELSADLPASGITQTGPDAPQEWPSTACPATDPEHGDLTPAFAAWYVENHPEDEVKAKYSGRRDLLEQVLGGVK